MGTMKTMLMTGIITIAASMVIVLVLKSYLVGFIYSSLERNENFVAWKLSTILSAISTCPENTTYYFTLPDANYSVLAEGHAVKVVFHDNHGDREAVAGYSGLPSEGKMVCNPEKHVTYEIATDGKIISFKEAEYQ